MDKFDAGKIMVAFGRKLVDEGLCGLDLDPNAPFDGNNEDFGRDVATVDLCIIEPDDLPEAAELDLGKVVREAGAKALASVNEGRRKKAVLVIGDGSPPVPAGTRVVHLHDRTYAWRFSIELYTQSKDGAKRAYANRRALKTWKRTSRTRRPQVARVLVRP